MHNIFNSFNVNFFYLLMQRNKKIIWEILLEKILIWLCQKVFYFKLNLYLFGYVDTRGVIAGRIFYIFHVLPPEQLQRDRYPEFQCMQHRRYLFTNFSVFVTYWKLPIINLMLI